MWRLLVILLVSAAGVFGQDDDIVVEDTDAQAPSPPEIRYLHIESNIAFRFSTTKVSSMLANRDTKPREAIFTIQLPKSAFITTFSMTIEGVTYDGRVKEKEAARREYIEAKEQGQSAGHIAAKPRNTNAFEVSVNVASQQKVTFNLTYQELLQRTLAMYQNVMYINPGQIVPDLKVDVFINESREINSLRVPALQKNVEDTLNTFEANTHATVTKISPTSAHVSYYPTEALQKEMSAKGISGQFVVQYDVQRGYDAGDIQVVDGYFVHFLAPAGLPAVKKNVLFILDISGSMSGTKLAQTKDAMRVILRDLQPGDLFNIFLFDDRIRKWNATHLVAVDDNSLRAAQEYVTNMSAIGSTDINQALTKGIKFLDKQRQQEKPINPSSLIVFLTDGDPTSGVTNIDRILSNVREANENSGYSIFSLGFGQGVDFGFLRKISLQNNGIARKIYEDSDAALQLQGFYKEISTPLLTDLKVEYLDVENTTRVEFPNYFNGSEIVICGIFEPDMFDIDGDDDDDDLPEEPIFRTKVRGRSNGNDVIIEKEVDVEDASNTGLRASTERLWAYLTIRELLDKMEKADDADAKAEIKAKALRLSLQYSFVTPLTSMIVKKPNANDSSSGLSDSDAPQAVPSRGRAQFSPGVYSGPAPQGLSGGRQSKSRQRTQQNYRDTADVALDADLVDEEPPAVRPARCPRKCKPGFMCKLVQVQCVRAPCPKRRQCVAIELVCPPISPDTGGTCAEECPRSGCPNGTKCCSNGCGHTCQVPVPLRNNSALQNSYVMLHGIEGPRVIANISGVKICHDPPVTEGETLVVKDSIPSGARVYANFTTIDDELVMTGVRVVIPKYNLTMTANLVKIDIVCHGTPESINWQDLFGTNKTLVMPGLNKTGQGRGQGRGRGGSHHGQGRGRNQTLVLPGVNKGRGRGGGHHGQGRGRNQTLVTPGDNQGRLGGGQGRGRGGVGRDGRHHGQGRGRNQTLVTPGANKGRLGRGQGRGRDGRHHGQGRGRNQTLVTPGVNQSRLGGGEGQRRGGHHRQIRSPQSQGRGGGHHRGQDRSRGKGRGRDIGMHHDRRANRTAWATMESHQLRIHISRKLCLLVTRNTDLGLLTDYLSLKLEVQRPGGARPGAAPVHGMMGKYLSGRVDSNRDFLMTNRRGRMTSVVNLDNHLTVHDFANPFSKVDEACKFF